MKRLTNLVVAAAMALAACADDGGEGRTASKLSEVEGTTQSGSTTTVQRSELRYDGARLKEVLAFLNGAPNGTALVKYGASGIEKIEYADKQGDRATENNTYNGGRLTRSLF